MLVFSELAHLVKLIAGEMRKKRLEAFLVIPPSRAGYVGVHTHACTRLNKVEVKQNIMAS